MDPQDSEGLAGKHPATDDSQSTYCESQEPSCSMNMFPESPCYDFPDSEDSPKCAPHTTDSLTTTAESNKRKLSDGEEIQSPKFKKLDLPPMDSQLIDAEVSNICSKTIRPTCANSPASQKLLTPVRSSPRKITKRSNSCTNFSEDTSQPLPFRSRAASTDSPPVQRPTAPPPPDISEENIDLDDSQTLHLQLSSSCFNIDDTEPTITESSKQPEGQPVLAARHKSRLSNDKATDQDTTDSVSSINLDSPDAPTTVTNKLITKLSNGQSSTPTEGSDHISENRVKYVTEVTPSTISPGPHGKINNTIRTPREPAFDIHIGRDEDGEFLSMYIVRADHELAQDMEKELSRISKRFTMDPYLGDVSKSSSPSSLTSGPGMIALPQPHHRASFTTTSSGSSSRTSDGAFVVPPPPAKSNTSNSTAGIQGYHALLRKIREILCPGSDPEESINKTTTPAQPAAQHSTSNGSNGVASPEEISRCDRATPKSSLKKSKGRGRRPLAGKSKRNILPTQMEEPEYPTTLNSPEMLPSGDAAPPALAAPAPCSPRSATRGRGRRRAESPRPAPARTAHPHPPGTLVLAKWVDKRYYSGMVMEVLEGGKYQIEFDDGRTKTLPDDCIIFGDRDQLPLKGQSVYAMVDAQQNYEPGLVLDVECGEGGAFYRCITDGESTVCIMANELYMTEDQARSLLETKPTPGTPGTPRRRLNRDLDLDNIIHGPRSARSRRNKSPGCPASPKASTSGKHAPTPLVSRMRQASESSEVSEGGAQPPPPTLEEVCGVEPELHKTPRKIDGVKAGPLQLKGLARQTVGKKNSKLTQFENDADTVSLLGPIPSPGSRLFAGLHFLLTCSGDLAPRQTARLQETPSRHRKNSSSDGDTSTSAAYSDHEDMHFSHRPFHKERLKEQLEAGGGVVYSHFDDLPKQHYTHTLLIAPRPCRTAKYIQCLAAGVRALTHDWVVASCSENKLYDQDRCMLPVGWSIMKKCFINWRDRGDCKAFKSTTVAICGEAETFVKFWCRVCSLAGIDVQPVNEDHIHLGDAVALLTDPDCPHEVQNKASLDAVPLVSTQWLWQCIIEGRVVPPMGDARFAFSYTDPD